jgi:nitrite reductase/ring-hydroxylating ferredoxin subunit
VATIVFMLGAALSGAADYVDTDGTARARATVHSSIMVVGLVAVIVSLVLRQGDPVDRTAPVVLGILGFLLVTAGAYVGGDVVYQLGNMVNRHAFRGRGTKWLALDLGDLADLQLLPEATPTKAKAGANDVVVVRIGQTVHAMHAVCAHAGGPLAEGTVVDGCLECPWHGSRFRLENGHVARGPSVYDQPAYEVRAAEGGGYEARRTAG